MTNRSFTLTFTRAAWALGLAVSATVAGAAVNNSSTTLGNGQSVLGAQVPTSAAARVVDVALSPVLNVECGETVTFRSGNQQFSWKFDVVGHRAVDLQAIAPAGFSASAVTVYIARNERERN